MLFGRLSRKTLLIQKQTPAYSVIRHDWNFKWDWLLWSDETKFFFSFLAANTQDGFGEHRDKMYPMCTMKYTAVDIVGLYFCWRPWISCLDMWHHGFYQIPTDKNQQVTESVRNLVMGHVWIFQPDNNLNTNLKNNTKNGSRAQNQASAMAIPVLWPEPVEHEWGELKKHRHGAVNLKDLERFWMKEWSLISCQVFSNLIRHYRRKFNLELLNWQMEVSKSID